MEEKYLEKYFINPGIEYGIKSYLLNKENLAYKRIHTFEMHVIKVLTIIYGEKSILLPYKIDNERAFECNLLMYDLKEQDMINFLKYMNEYYLFMQNIKSESKATGLISEIESILLEMILKRSKRKEFTEDEIKEFDTIFNPLDGELKNIKKLVSKNHGLIIREWENSKSELTNTQIRMIAVNPNLLTREEYSKYGYDIRLIATLSEDEISKVNNVIWKEETKEYTYDKKKSFKFGNMVLTSGNGFVDKLMLLSIIATELMIGVIVFSKLGG
jgi:hypothetical protein